MKLIILKRKYIIIIELFLCFCPFLCAQTINENDLEKNPTWAEEFDKHGFPDQSKWVVSELKQKNHDALYVKNKKNCYVKNGYLHLTLRHTPQKKYNYESGRIHTQENVTFKYGKLVIRAKGSIVKGAWEAIWMKPKEGIKTSCKGEIDIMEYIGSWKNEKFQINFHLWGNIQGKKNSHIQYPKYPKIDISDWHIYTINWHKDRIIILVDDIIYYDLKKEDIPEWPFDLDYMLILAFGYGPDWDKSQSRDDKALPQTLLIDYIRYYKLKE